MAEVPCRTLENSEDGNYEFSEDVIAFPKYLVITVILTWCEHTINCCVCYQATGLAIQSCQMSTKQPMKTLQNYKYFAFFFFFFKYENEKPRTAKKSFISREMNFNKRSLKVPVSYSGTTVKVMERYTVKKMKNESLDIFDRFLTSRNSFTNATYLDILVCMQWFRTS